MARFYDIVLFEVLNHPLLQLLLAHRSKEFLFQRLKEPLQYIYIWLDLLPNLLELLFLLLGDLRLGMILFVLLLEGGVLIV